MAKSKKIGNCHICGNYGELTFEHIPPEASFNDRTIINVPFEKILELNDFDAIENLKGRSSQRGLGDKTLCETCNNNTGAWYGNAFVSWTKQGALLSKYASTAPSLYYTFQIFPLRVIKQIICIFFSVNPVGFNKQTQELVRFVLNKNHKYLGSVDITTKGF